MNNLNIQERLTKFTGQLVIEIHDAKTGKLKSRDVYNNMFVTVGKNSVARGLQGDTGAGEITYATLGTSAVAPALTDTQLGAEVGRKLISVRSFSGNVATFQTYFGTSEANGSLREAGLFGETGVNGASLTPNSGVLYCRAAISRTKTTNDTLTLTWNVTVG